MQSTTSNSLSEYARALLLRKRVIVRYRNQTADEFLSEMIRLKNELNAIGTDFNQAVHKLHILDHDRDIKVWAILNETCINLFMKKTDEMQRKVHEIIIHGYTMTIPFSTKPQRKWSNGGFKLKISSSINPTVPIYLASVFISYSAISIGGALLCQILTYIFLSHRPSSHTS